MHRKIVFKITFFKTIECLQCLLGTTFDNFEVLLSKKYRIISLYQSTKLVSPFLSLLLTS